MIETGEQEGTELAAVGADRLEIILGEEPGEELLDEVLGVVGLVAAAPDIGVQRVPIGGAKLFEGASGFRGIVLAGSDYNPPRSSREPLAPDGRRLAAFIVGNHGAS